MVRHARKLLVPALLLACCGCARLPPLEDVRSQLATGSLVRVGDQQVHVERMGHGEPLLLIHGFGASSYSWRKVLPALARDYDVIAPDLNGFGWTDRRDDRAAYTREGQVRLILDLMQTLGLEDAHFVGHSYGGALTMTLAAHHPQRVRSMVLVDAAEPDYPLKRRKTVAGVRPVTWLYLRGMAFRKSRLKKLFRRAYHDDTQVTDDLVEAYLDRMRVEGSVTAYQNLTRSRKSAKRDTIRYADLRVPALVVWGAEDRLVPESTGRRYARLLPDHRFVSIEDAGHSPMEERPDEFLGHVTEFLAQISDD